MKSVSIQFSRIAFSLGLLMGLFLSSSASVVVYRTYQEYESNRGTAYDDYKGATVQMGKVTMTLTKGGLEEKVKCSEIWGLTYNDKLFRIDKMGSPVMLWSQGKVCFYENGTAHMEAMRKGREVATVSSGFVNYISHDLKSPVQELPIGMGQVKKEVNAFVAEQPESASLFECIGKINDPDKTRECVKTFEGK